eukprot:scaffold16580_cov37-Cyclotella_meneghiniana.AAC.1
MTEKPPYWNVGQERMKDIVWFVSRTWPHEKTMMGIRGTCKDDPTGENLPRIERKLEALAGDECPVIVTTEGYSVCLFRPREESEEFKGLRVRCFPNAGEERETRKGLRDDVYDVDYGRDIWDPVDSDGEEHIIYPMFKAIDYAREQSLRGGSQGRGPVEIIEDNLEYWIFIVQRENEVGKRVLAAWSKDLGSVNMYVNKDFLVHFDHGYSRERYNLEIRGPTMMRRKERMVRFAVDGTRHEGWTAFEERSKCQKMLMVLRFWRDYFVYNHGHKQEFDWRLVGRFDNELWEWKSQIDDHMIHCDVDPLL